MKTLIFGGSGDDTFGEISSGGDDYDNCSNGKPIEYLITSPQERKELIVFGQYAPSHCGGWVVGIAPYDPEDDHAAIPDWPVRIRPPKNREASYSPVLEIDVPDDATIRCLQRGPTVASY